MRREGWISLVILVAGIVLLAQTASSDVTVERERFDSFPNVIDIRAGIAEPLPAPVIEQLGVTDYLSRTYAAPGLVPANLYIGFYASQRTGATYHSPLNCLPGNGWQILDKTAMPLPALGNSAKVNEILIGKGLERQVVVYWYHDRGRIIASEYMAKIYMVLDAALRHRTDGALVRVVVPVQDDEAAARRTARDFANRILPLLNGYLPG